MKVATRCIRLVLSKTKRMGTCGCAPRVAAGASGTALRPLEVGRLRLRGRALLGTLPPPLMRHYQLDVALGFRPVVGRYGHR